MVENFWGGGGGIRITWPSDHVREKYRKAKSSFFVWCNLAWKALMMSITALDPHSPIAQELIDVTMK